MVGQEGNASSVGSAFTLSIFWALLAILTFILSFGHIVSQPLWAYGIVGLIVSICFLVLGVARRQRHKSMRP